jgi:hypothetical protein
LFALTTRITWLGRPRYQLRLPSTTWTISSAWARCCGRWSPPLCRTLTPEELIALAREGYLSQIAVADPQTMRDQTVLFVDFNELNGQVGRTFRSIPPEVEPIVANLSLANMDFAEFADNTNPDGIFCGF